MCDTDHSTCIILTTVPRQASMCCTQTVAASATGCGRTSPQEEPQTPMQRSNIVWTAPRAVWSAAVRTVAHGAPRASRLQGLATGRRCMVTTQSSHLSSLLATAPPPSARCSPHRWMVLGACAMSILLARIMQCRSRSVLSDIFAPLLSCSCLCRCWRHQSTSWFAA